MNKNTWNEIVKPIVVLSVISLVAAAALAAVNMVTAPVIEENERLTTLSAYMEVLPGVADASALEEVKDYQTTGIEGVVKTADGQYAIKAAEKGFDGGAITVILGFDADGVISGSWVDASTQTAGLGSHMSDPEMKDQFVGLDGTQNVAMGENGLDGRTGATISSNALFAAVNDCINCYNEVALGQEATIVEEYVNPTKEEAIAAMAPDAAEATAPEGCDEAYTSGDVTVLVASSQGMESTVTVAVAFDASGAITSVWVDAAAETEGLGTKCMEPAFTDLFAGAASADDVAAVDAISGSTVTSDAVKTAVEACVNGLAAM